MITRSYPTPQARATERAVQAALGMLQAQVYFPPTQLQCEILLYRIAKIQEKYPVNFLDDTIADIPEIHRKVAKQYQCRQTQSAHQTLQRNNVPIRKPARRSRKKSAKRARQRMNKKEKKKQKQYPKIVAGLSNHNGGQVISLHRSCSNP